MSSTYVPIVSIEADESASVEKTTGHRPSETVWVFPVVYVLDDGRRQPATSRHTRKRDAVAELGTLPKPPEHPTKAAFGDNGEFWGTQTSYSLR